MKVIQVIILSGLAIGAMSCGNSGFTGDSGRTGKVTPAGGTTTPDNPSTIKENGPPGNLPDGPGLSSDDQAIATCLAKFGQHPFGEGADYKKISASVSVLGVGTAVKDTEVTSSPRLILIGATVNVLGEAKYELLNPNGWYCLKVDVNVQATTRIKLHCDAKLADNKVNVGVMADAEPTGRVGVHVLSDVSIERVGSCE